MIHIFSMKGKTKGTKIQSLIDPPFLYIPLFRQYGYSPEPVVSVGDEVRKYQLIGRDKTSLSANIHAPVSGTVHEIKEYPQTDGTMVNTIVIKNDLQKNELPLTRSTHEDYSPEQLLSIINEAGIVGEGGAQFPTAIKYNVDGSKISTFIINGTECEPYLTSDYALMKEHTEELFAGINIANRILKAENVVITIEKQNRDLQDIFSPLMQRSEYKYFRLVILPDSYPQGGELQLIRSVTGIEMPRQKRPREVGVIVSNVGTVHAIYEAVVNGKPVTDRIVTVSGEKAINHGAFRVKIGTPVGHIIKTLGLETNNNTVVMGGPMMGKAVVDLTTPVTKGTGGLLILKKEKIKRSNCISCGYCVDACPMGLMPMRFEEYYRRGKYFNLEKYNISNCIECAACEYICPSNVPLIESIKEGKSKLKELANAIQ